MVLWKHLLLLERNKSSVASTLCRAHIEIHVELTKTDSEMSEFLLINEARHLCLRFRDKSEFWVEAERRGAITCELRIHVIIHHFIYFLHYRSTWK